MNKKLLPLFLALFLLLTPLAAAAEEETPLERAQFSGITAAADGSLLLTDTYNKVVWQQRDGNTAIFAGKIGAASGSGEPIGAYYNGDAASAFFQEPWDIVPFLTGYAVSDAASHVIRFIADGQVKTLAGTTTAGSADGAGSAASFNRPTGLAVGDDGALYVADTGNGSIRRIDTSGLVTTVVSGALSGPTGLCWQNGALYVVETDRCRICRIANGQVQPFAGSSEPTADAGEYLGGYRDGPVATARFDHPQGIAAGADGALYVSDAGNSAVRRIADGRVTTLARSSSDKLLPESPRGLLAQQDRLYVADHFAGGLLTLSVAPTRFSDVPAQEWYADAAAVMTERQIIRGTDDGRFLPYDPCNRAMFVTLLSRVHLNADGSAVINGSQSFPDAIEGDWYDDAARWALEQGVINGDDGRLVPLRTVDREEMATMLYRYAAQQGLDTGTSGDAAASFSDAGQISIWAADAMRWACGRGILNGSDNRLRPAAAATRAEAVTILYRFMEAYGL